MKKIILLGYMGVGKSTVANILAKKLAIKSFDLDDLIEESQQKTISDIFKQNGEIYFRKIEAQVLRQFISNQQSFVLALGGGTPCYANNHELLKAEGITSVYLRASTDVLVDRLKQEQQKRPLIAHLNSVELKDYITKHLFDRSYYYHQSKRIIDTDNKTPDQIASQILEFVL